MKTETTTTTNLKILLVEDNLINQEVAMFILTKKGYSVLIANNGEEAVAMAEKETIDLLLMDVQMPRMNGYQATEKIRQMEANTGAHKPIIGLTANAMKGDKEKCLQAGMDAYLTKPIIKEDLYKLIESFMKITT
jgi:two-component system, sensor histidine kinase and response regulator